MKKWKMIVNPASASEKTRHVWKDSLDMLTRGGLEVDHVMTERPGHAINLAWEAAAQGYRQFISVGGDGTIHEVMTGLLRHADAEGLDLGDFTLAVLPYGTGNDWIKTAGIPKDMAEATRSILAGKVAREDVVRLTFEDGVFCMANIGGIGIDADISIRTNTLKRKGYTGGLLYKLVAPYIVFTKRCHPVEIVCDGESVYKGRLYSVAIGNGLYRGGGIRQTEEGSRWDDGHLEISILGEGSHLKAARLMMHALSGDFAAQQEIITRRFRKMTVTPLGPPHLVESDGEVPGILPVTVEVTGQQIQIIVPEQA